MPTLPSLPSPDPQTLKETGVVGGVGDIIYNITHYGELRERVIERVTEPRDGRESALEETERISPPGGLIDPEGVFARSVSMTVAEDIHEGGLFPGVIGIPGSEILGISSPATTIGAGLGAISQHFKWKETLTPKAREIAEYEESAKRLKFLQTPEGGIAAGLTTIFSPLGLFTAISTAIDVVRTSKPKPAPAPEPYVAPTAVIDVGRVGREKERWVGGR